MCWNHADEERKKRREGKGVFVRLSEGGEGWGNSEWHQIIVPRIKIRFSQHFASTFCKTLFLIS